MKAGAAKPMIELALVSEPEPAKLEPAAAETATVVVSVPLLLNAASLAGCGLVVVVRVPLLVN